MRNRITAAQDGSSSQRGDTLVERFATVILGSCIQAQGPVIWRDGARACVEVSPGRQITGLLANAA